MNVAKPSDSDLRPLTGSLFDFYQETRLSGFNENQAFRLTLTYLSSIVTAGLNQEKSGA